MATSEDLFRESFGMELAGRSRPTPPAPPKWQVAIWNEKWVDLATGLIYDEKSKKVTQGDPESALLKSIETRTYKIEYTK